MWQSKHKQWNYKDTRFKFVVILHNFLALKTTCMDEYYVSLAYRTVYINTPQAEQTHPRRMESSAKPLWVPQSHTQSCCTDVVLQLEFYHEVFCGLQTTWIEEEFHYIMIFLSLFYHSKFSVYIFIISRDKTVQVCNLFISLWVCMLVTINWLLTS